MTYKFSVRERLKSRKAIENLFAKGQTVFQYPLKVFYVLSTEPHLYPPKVLFAVPKKKVRKAHQRNRFKRQLREAYRLEKKALLDANGLYGLETIGFVYVATEAQPSKILHKKMRQILEKLPKK